MTEPVGVRLGEDWLYQALPKQVQVHAAPEKNVLYGGAAGPGKSWGIRWHGIMRCLAYPGLRCLLLRRQFTELEQTHLIDLKALPTALAKYDASKHRLNFPNASLMQFGHCNSDADFASYLSTEWGLILLDEAGQFTPYQLTMLPSRLRAPSGIPTQIVYATNPGGPGHSWLYDRFIAKAVRDDTKYRAKDWWFVEAKVTDNPHITQDYIDRLDALPDLERRRYRDGDWNLPSGNLFGELDRLVHWQPYTGLWPDARRVVSADWGWDAPAPALWIQSDAGLDDQPVRSQVYREWGPRETIPMDWALGVIERSGIETPATCQAKGLPPERAWVRGTPEDEGVTVVILDSAAWARGEDGTPSPAEQMAPTFQKAKMRLTQAMKGEGSVALGVSLLHTYFHTAGGAVPPLLTIADTCPLLWDALTTIQRGDPTKLNDPRAADKPAPRQPQTHLCLVGETLISTAYGLKAIRNVGVGDMVWTRQGWRAVTASAKTGDLEPLWRVETSTGRSVTGTANHPIWTRQRGFVAIDSLRYGDTLLTVEDLCPEGGGSIRRKPWWSRGSSGLATRPTPSPRCDATTETPTMAGTCTAGAGVRPTGRFRQAVTFTTAMATGVTTRWRTWSASRPSSTPGTTGLPSDPSGLGGVWWRRWCRWRERGTALRRAMRGIARMVGRHGSTASRRITSVVFADVLFNPATGGKPTTAATTVSLRPGGTPGWMTLRSYAEDVEALTGLTSTCPPSFVTAVVPAGHGAVYNLTVEGTHEFFAGGILVSNCDALRYYCQSRPRPATLTLEQAIARDPLVKLLGTDQRSLRQAQIDRARKDKKQLIPATGVKKPSQRQYPWRGGTNR